MNNLSERERTPKLSNLTVRILSALGLAPVVLALVYVGGWPFSLLLMGAAILMAGEWSRLAYGPKPAAYAKPECWLVAAAAVAAVLGLMVGLSWLALAAPVLAALIGAGWRLAQNQPIGSLLFGVAYIAAPVIALTVLRADAVLGLTAVLWVLAIVWATDIFAYAAGRLIGGPKLAPRYSPNKTWAGLGGGVMGAAAAGAGMALWAGANPLFLAVLSACLAVLAQFGDFVESALKRRAGVKDSGSLIPGHGGILDRVDGLMFAAAGAALVGGVMVVLTNGPDSSGSIAAAILR